MQYKKKMTNNASLVKGMKPNAFRGLLIGIFKFFYDAGIYR